jgi:hypothetical protein
MAREDHNPIGYDADPVSLCRGKPTRHLNWQLCVRLSPAQYDLVYKRAREAGLTMSEFIRTRLIRSEDPAR